MYTGQPVCPVNAAHGNAARDKPFIRTNPSVLARIKQIAAATGDQARPAKLYKEAIRTTDTSDNRQCPRNIKQVCVIDLLSTGIGNNCM